MSELRQQGDDIHQQMCHMYNIFKDIAKSHGKGSSTLNGRFVDSLSCDSEDCYDPMDWKALESRWKVSQNNGAGSVDSGYKSDYPSLNDVIACPSYPKKPKILMGTRLIGWQKSRDSSSIHQQQSHSQFERKNSDTSASMSSINEEHLEEKLPREDTCLLSPPLRIVRFSDSVKTSRCKRIVPKYKKNRLSLKGTPAPSENVGTDCSEDTKAHSYGKIVYYDLDRVDFLSTTLEESQGTRNVTKDFKRCSPKETHHLPTSVNEPLNRSPHRVANFKRPGAVKTIQSAHYNKHTSKVDSKHANSASTTRQKHMEARHIAHDPHRTKDDLSDSSHIYEEIIYDTSPKDEGSRPMVPPLPIRPKELWKSVAPTPRDESTKYYRRKSNLLRSMSNKMEKLTISNSQMK